jgi:hypothetical protein
MEDTLKKLGYEYTKTNEGLSINRPYYPIEITKNEISCDSMNQRDLEKIKYMYQKDFQVYERTIRGEQFEVIETNQEIVIMVQ